MLNGTYVQYFSLSFHLEVPPLPFYNKTTVCITVVILTRLEQNSWHCRSLTKHVRDVRLSKVADVSYFYLLPTSTAHFTYFQKRKCWLDKHGQDGDRRGIKTVWPIGSSLVYETFWVMIIAFLNAILTILLLSQIAEKKPFFNCMPVAHIVKATTKQIRHS